ncbi:hypothetical protein CMU11_12625 [Elizabethkingia anophelis]|uniref:hypothetical protein n=1 Tax=Elizabethkingia anophelis TaxID=1117645 RepID=UPI0012B24837|nr:hypothetical protein [Elizabethkingia anophelis]MCT4182396.1 hypothetical protein [Elizabethkingia anophelis]MCT4272010.1 hypothetical protein [Elizabethkingia anophelis]MCT4289578.1 hypothetical protein [Elizabethkingia anophelis]MDV3737951.1 hypothetical protein [Elizabethkingia anophelis]QGN23906.1 hypothetical protein GJV56_15060 [Elizabethkingia anophelis]
MNTKKVLKKLEEIGGFENVTLEGKNKVIATYTEIMNSIDDQKLKEITKKFPSERYDYEINVQEGKLILEIKDSKRYLRSQALNNTMRSGRVFFDPTDFMYRDPWKPRF